MADQVRLTAEQVSLVLKRAAELDARGPSVSAEELIAIAAEAGLDPAATRAAIEEITAPKPLPATPTRSFMSAPSLLSTVGGGVLGFMLGLIGTASLGPGIGMPALGGTLIFTLYRWLRRRGSESRLVLFFEHFVTWLSFIVGAAAADNRMSVDIMIMAMLAGAITSVLCLVLPHGSRTQTPELPAGSSLTPQ